MVSNLKYSLRFSGATEDDVPDPQAVPALFLSRRCQWQSQTLLRCRSPLVPLADVVLPLLNLLPMSKAQPSTWRHKPAHPFPAAPSRELSVTTGVALYVSKMRRSHQNSQQYLSLLKLNPNHFTQLNYPSSCLLWILAAGCLCCARHSILTEDGAGTMTLPSRW